MRLLEVQSLSKRFGGLLAVNAVSFDVEEGEILAVIGPNGAGKSDAVQADHLVPAAERGPGGLPGRGDHALRPHMVARAASCAPSRKPPFSGR